MEKIEQEDMRGRANEYNPRFDRTALGITAAIALTVGSLGGYQLAEYRLTPREVYSGDLNGDGLDKDYAVRTREYVGQNVHYFLQQEDGNQEKWRGSRKEQNQMNKALIEIILEQEMEIIKQETILEQNRPR